VAELAQRAVGKRFDRDALSELGKFDAEVEKICGSLRNKL